METRFSLFENDLFKRLSMTSRIDHRFPLLSKKQQKDTSTLPEETEGRFIPSELLRCHYVNYHLHTSW